jgi:hypothetical protein
MESTAPDVAGAAAQAAQLLAVGAAASGELDVARASIIVGCLQDACMCGGGPIGDLNVSINVEAVFGARGAAAACHHTPPSLAPSRRGPCAGPCTLLPLLPPQPEIEATMARFQSDLLTPALAKMARAKTPEAKLVALSKHLWTRLSKAAAHKQPLHAQFLTSALRQSGARRLDCLGIAAGALALCRAAAAAEPGAHADLAGARLVVSDDHCWLRLPGGGVGGSDLDFEVRGGRGSAGLG